MFRKPKRIPPPRKVLVVDPDVQGALLIRLAIYAASGLIYFSIIELLDVILSDSSQSRLEILWNFVGRSIYWAPGLFVLIPIFAYDLLTLSNRFAGPVIRVRREIRALSMGKDTRPLELRVDDFWLEMADDYNHLREEVHDLREKLAAVPEVQDEKTVRKGSLFGNKQAADTEQATKDAKIMDEMLESVGA